MPYTDVVSSIIKAFRMLNLFRGHSELGVTEIAHTMDMAKGSVYRFLNSFKRLGLVQQNPETGRYRPAVGLLELSSLYMDHLEWHHVVRPLLEDLSEKTQGEAVHLAVREDTKVVYVDKIEGQQTLRMVSRIGLRRPAHCTGTGKALLATMSDKELVQLYKDKELTRFTDHTITDLNSLLKEIDTCRRRTYAVDAEENELGIVCIGAAIRGRQGEAVAAISVSGPTIRISGSRIDEFGRLVLEATAEASRRLGWRESRDMETVP